jgi:alpha-beta hydrolase superfamily lysophospholipase
MRARGSVAAVIAIVMLAAALAGVPPATAAEPVASVNDTVDIGCAGATLRQPVRWQLPPGPPRGLVWLQHGFARSPANVADLAVRLARAGFVVFSPALPVASVAGCTEENLGDNTPFLRAVADLLNPVNPALARSFRRAERAAGRPPSPLPARAVLVGHSAGGEAMEFIAATLVAEVPGAVRGLVLLDPVSSFLGDTAVASLRRLDRTALPLAVVASPPAPCNGFGGNTAAVRRIIRRPFVGVRLVRGTHTDAEGASTDLLGELCCGAPSPADVSALQTLTAAWVADDLTGRRTPDVYPGGRYYQTLLDTGVAVTLTGARP